MSVEDIMHVMGACKEILLGACGGMVSYLLDYTKAKRNGDTAFVFKPSSMLINILLGMFVAYNVGTLLPTDTIGRDALIGLSGVTSYQILLLAESKFATWIVDKITKKG